MNLGSLRLAGIAGASMAVGALLAGWFHLPGASAQAPIPPPPPGGRYIMQTNVAQPIDGGQVYCYVFDTQTRDMVIYVNDKHVSEARLLDPATP